jgi:hypothetical protein
MRMGVKTKWTLVSLSLLLSVLLQDSCKPRRKGKAELAGNGPQSETDVLNRVIAIEAMHAFIGLPLIEEEKEQDDFNPLPKPGSCSNEWAWKADLRWGHASATYLHFQLDTSQNPIVKIAALSAMAKIASMHRLFCGQEYVQDQFERVLAQFNQYCTDFKTCGRFMGFLFDLDQAYPELEKLKDYQAYDSVERQIETVKEKLGFGFNTARTMQFRLRALRFMHRFNLATSYHDNTTMGRPVQVDQKTVDSLKQELNDVRRYGQQELFVVNRWGGQLSIDPATVNDYIIEDIYGENLPAFKALEEPERKVIESEALGVYEAAWSIDHVLAGTLVYLDRLGGDQLLADSQWLNDIAAAVGKNTKKNSPFQRQDAQASSGDGSDEGSLSPLTDIGSFNWRNGMDPVLAFHALTLYYKREMSLPSRLQWKNTLNGVVNLIPKSSLTNLAAKKAEVDVAFNHFGDAVVQRFAGMGLIPSPEKDENGKEKPLTRELSHRAESDKAVIATLVSKEHELKRKFPDFVSAEVEFRAMTEVLTARALGIQNALEWSKSHANASREEKDKVNGNIREVTFNVLTQWMRISCLSKLALDENSTKVSGVFNLEDTVNYDFDCKEALTNGTLRPLQNLTKDLTGYVGTFQYHRDFNEGLSGLKEWSMHALMIVTFGPISSLGRQMAVNVVKFGARFAGESAAKFLAKGIVMQLVVGATFATTNTAMTLVAQDLFDRFLGSQALPQEISAEQIAVSGGFGLAMMMSMGGVSRLAGMIGSRLIPGVSRVGAQAATTELSTFVSKLANTSPKRMPKVFAQTVVGVGLDTAMFTSMEYVVEGLSIKMSGVELTENQKAMMNLQSKNFSERLRSSFVMAGSFRTLGLLHLPRQAPPTTESDRLVEIMDHFYGDSPQDYKIVTSEQAKRILGISESSEAAIKSARRKVVAKLHPDRVSNEITNQLSQLDSFKGSSAQDMIAKLRESMNQGQTVSELWRSGKFKSVSAADWAKVVKIYRGGRGQIADFKLANAAADFLK